MENSMGMKLKNQMRRKWTEEAKQKHYEEWKASGLSQRAYCTQQALPIKTFNGWIQMKEKKPEHFSLVTIKEPTWVEVTWNNKMVCRFSEGIDMRWLMEMIRKIHHVACDTE